MTFILALVSVAALQPAGPFWDHFENVADVGSGRLLLILLDVDGDARKEIFLAPSGTCGNGGCAWYVYSPTGVPNQVRYLGEADFSSGSFRLDRPSHTLTSCWRMSAAECVLTEYRVQGGTMSHRKMGACRTEDAACAAELTRIARWQRTEAPPVWSAAVPESIDLRRLEWSQSGMVTAGDNGVPPFNSLTIRERR
jgi:hypothetical protein